MNQFRQVPGYGFGIIAIYINFNDVEAWVEEMDKLIKEGDFVIISGSDKYNLRDLFGNSGKYEDINSHIPPYILNIFKTAITEQFIVSTFRELQYIHPLRPIKILRKREEQELALPDSRDTINQSL